MMKRYFTTLMLAGFCFAASAQDMAVSVRKVVGQTASDVKKLNWSDMHIGDEDACRVSFNAIRNNAVSPLRGELLEDDRFYIIKGDHHITDVVCFAKGVVIRSAGDCVVVDHGNGLESIYRNILSKKVKVGDKVKKGQLIGRLSVKERYLLFDLQLDGVSLKLTEMLDPKTSMISYAGDLYLYKIDKTPFLSRLSPMALLSVSDEYLYDMFESHYNSFIDEHRAQKDVVDTSMESIIQEEISLEDVQVGPAKEQEALKDNNEIVL